MNFPNILSQDIRTAQSVGAMPSLVQSNIVFGQPQSGTNGLNIVGANFTSATSTATMDPTNASTTITRFRRSRHTSAAGAGSGIGPFTGHPRWYRGGTGGFAAFFRVGLSGANTTGYRAFVGFTATVAQLTVDPSSMLNMIGVGYDAADANSGTWFVMHNDGTGSATRVAATGMTRDLTSAYDVYITMPQGNTAQPTVSIFNANTQALVFSHTPSTDLPVAGTLMAVKMEVHNGAVAAATGIDIAKFQIISADQ